MVRAYALVCKYCHLRYVLWWDLNCGLWRTFRPDRSQRCPRCGIANRFPRSDSVRPGMLVCYMEEVRG